MILFASLFTIIVVIGRLILMAIVGIIQLVIGALSILINLITGQWSSDSHTSRL